MPHPRQGRTPKERLACIRCLTPPHGLAHPSPRPATKDRTPYQNNIKILVLPRLWHFLLAWPWPFPFIRRFPGRPPWRRTRGRTSRLRGTRDRSRYAESLRAFARPVPTPAPRRPGYLGLEHELKSGLGTILNLILHSENFSQIRRFPIGVKIPGFGGIYSRGIDPSGLLVLLL